jgi:indole-3-glycerol phosphate synthase
VATFLETAVERAEADLARRKRELPQDHLRERLGPARRGRPFSEALVDEGISLVAEMKRSSPSRGAIRPGARAAEVVRAYEAAGAAACSILTEPHHFGGSLDDLAEARAATGLPLLRKDFLVDPYQVMEARVAGADAVLLIVAALDRDRLEELMEAAAGLGMDCLVEVHDEEDVATALEAGADVIGVNNRDLRTLEVDLRTTFHLLPDIPAGTVVVAESGITSRADVEELEEAGVDAILVGEALMLADEPGETIRALLGWTHAGS